MNTALNDDDRARAREPFFFEALKSFVSKVDLGKSGCNYSLDDKVILSRAYFVLNGFYKRWRLKESRNTKLTKIAALNIASVMAVRPFHSTTQSKTLFYLNPNFALTCAECCLANNFFDQNADHIRRLSVILDGLRFSVLNQFFNDEANGKSKSIAEYLAVIEQNENDSAKLANIENDIRQLDLVVTLCELAAGPGGSA